MASGRATSRSKAASWRPFPLDRRYIPSYPQLTRNYLEEEGVSVPPEPVQPGFFAQMGQTFRDAARSAAT